MLVGLQDELDKIKAAAKLGPQVQFLQSYALVLEIVQRHALVVKLGPQV